MPHWNQLTYLTDTDESVGILLQVIWKSKQSSCSSLLVWSLNTWETTTVPSWCVCWPLLIDCKPWASSDTVVLTEVTHLKTEAELPAIPSVWRTWLSQTGMLFNKSFGNILNLFWCWICIVLINSTSYSVKYVSLHSSCHSKQGTIFFISPISFSELKFNIIRERGYDKMVRPVLGRGVDGEHTEDAEDLLAVSDQSVSNDDTKGV